MTARDQNGTDHVSLDSNRSFFFGGAYVAVGPPRWRMLQGTLVLPLRSIALWGLGLHALWEFGQCTVLYDMWSWGFWRASAWMGGAILGDVVITLGVGFVASIGLEWAAQALDLWGYSDLMPTVTVLGHTVGLSPIVQVTLLPALAVWAATRHTLPT